MLNVYQSAKDVCEWLWPSLVPYGLVVFDDFGGAEPKECSGL